MQKISKNIKRITEQYFQYVAQKVKCDNNLDTFAVHFDQHFNQKPTPQHWCEVIKFEIIFILNPIRSIIT